MLSKSSMILALGLAAELVASHATVVMVKGDAGGATAMGLGVTPGVKRNSQIPTQPASSPNNPEADTSVFGHGNAAATGCGKTAMVSCICLVYMKSFTDHKQNGALKDAGSIQSAIQTMMTASGGLPSVSPGGTLTVMMHQVNADGAPTYSADVDPSGTGTGTFQQMTVTSGGQGAAGVLGDQGLSFNIGSLPANNTVTMQVPAGMTCTGAAPDGSSNSMCVARLKNNAAAGGFGSCMAFTMAGGSSGSTGTTATRRHAKEIKAREVPLYWYE